MKHERLTIYTWGLCAVYLGIIACGDDELVPVAEDLPLVPACADGTQPGLEGCPLGNGAIRGQVCDYRTGTWFVGLAASVVIDNQEFVSVSDEQGVFELDEIPPGSYFVQLSSDNFNGELVAHVQAGETSVIGDQACALPRGSLSGRVCDEEQGVWIAGATISLDDPDGSQVRSNSSGEYSFSDIIPGDYTVTITAPGYYNSRRATVVAGETTDLGPEMCTGAPGSIAGRICGGDGYWLSGASVRIDLDNGNIVETTTDADGFYLLTGVPGGTHTVEVTRGSFDTSFDVTLAAGEQVVIPEPVCIPPTTYVAVVTGIYDSVETVLGDLGFPVRQTFNSTSPTVNNPEGNVDIVKGDTSSFWITDFFADPVWMSDYEVIFINCGVEDSLLMSPGVIATTAVDNLRTFVQNGGSVYASDWGSEIIRLAFPGTIDFRGAETSFGAARIGVASSDLSAEAVDNGLITALGRSQLTINLDLPLWVVLEDHQAAHVTTLVRGDVRVCIDPPFCLFTEPYYDVPLVVRFDVGQGRVLFTSAHNESQTTPDLEDVLNYVIFEL